MTSIQLYNSRIIDTYIRLLKCRYSHIDINELLDAAGMKAYEVSDQGHWFTQQEIDRFYEKIVRLTGNKHIALEAGRYAASPESLGAMRQYILGLIGPAGTFGIINKASLKLTRSATYESRKISPHSVEVIVTPHTGVSEKPFQCENRIGFFAAIVLMFGHELPHIEHTECFFKGQKACRYIITWKNSRSLIYKRIGVGTTILFAIISMVLVLSGHVAQFQIVMQLFLPLILLCATIAVISENNELKASLDSTNNSSDKLLEQIDTNYNHALLVNEIGHILNNCTNTEEVLSLVIKIIENRLDFDQGLIFLEDPEKNDLKLQASFGCAPVQSDPAEHELLYLGCPQLKGIFDVTLLEQKPLLVNTLHEIKESISPQQFEFLQKTGIQSLICCPIISDGISIGLLVVANLTSKRLLIGSDISQLLGIASILGISLRNLELIEDKLRHEIELLKIDKLESMGILAGGIAHDFINMLTGIMGNITLAHMFLDSSHESHKPLLEAEKASMRAAELAQQLLTFARGGEPIKKPVSVQHVVYETISLVLHGSNVRGDIDIPDSIHAIEADEGQMCQVFHNIIINAKQAMPEGGTLTVRAQNEILADYNTLSIPAGTYVRITFTDQGCGIPEDILKRIFDPYFTTKPAGNGIGLASVQSIVKKHGGYIGASSIPGTGTTFTIYLPSTGEVCSSDLEKPVTKIRTSHAGGCILVMDDDELIRKMMAVMLKYLGYQVTTCASGERALAEYKAAMNAGTPFSAVIMDLTIPGGMGGKEAALQIHAIDPQACLIVSSGYLHDPIMADHKTYGFSGAVAKPYKMADLGQLMNSLLSGR